MQTIVGSQFLNTVQDNPKNLVLMTYNSYVQEKAEIEQLKKTFATIALDTGMTDTFEFLQIDYGLNDLVGVNVNSFPDFMILPAGSKPYIAFEGKYSENELIEWIDGFAKSVALSGDDTKSDL